MVTNDRRNTGSGGPLSDTDVNLPIEVLPVNDAPINQLASANGCQKRDMPYRIDGLQIKMWMRATPSCLGWRHLDSGGQAAAAVTGSGTWVAGAERVALPPSCAAGGRG